MLGHWAALLPLPLPACPSPIDAVSLGTWALQFTPRVALLEDSVVAEVSGCARLFGGMALLHHRVHAGAQELGARVAWAPTATAALALARHDTGPSGGMGFVRPWRRFWTVCRCTPSLRWARTRPLWRAWGAAPWGMCASCRAVA